MFMFCPTCGEMAFIRDGNGDEKTYYERVESSVNKGWAWWQEDKPVPENYNPDGSRKGDEKENSDDEASFENSSPKNLLRPKKVKSAYELDYDEWKLLGENIDPFNIVEKGKELEKKGVKYAQCKNYLCNYHGPAKKLDIGGKEIDFDELTSSVEVETREYEIIKDSDKMQGILTTDTYMCPKCDCIEVFAYLEQTRSSDEPETRMLTCKNCGHGWREY